MPPKANKVKNAPNQHDKRHESGLAAPGKRVARQRSNGQLNGNGHANGKPVESATAPPPRLPSTGLNQGIPFPRPTATNSSVETASFPPTKDYGSSSPGIERDRKISDASVEEMDPLEGSALPGCAQTTVETVPACRSNPAHSGSTFGIIATILTYYPLRDAIAILILLLSLPSTMLLIIQTLFASLTFVPPTAGISLSTLPNVREMFHAASIGTPALATILVVDMIVFLCWLPVWKPAQSFLLDLSQVVIAVSLSGAAASSGTPTNSVAICSSVVFAVHLLRYRAIHLTGLDYLRSVLHKYDIGVQLNFLSGPDYIPGPPVVYGWTYTVIRSALGIHILSQGATTVIRRYLSNANDRNATLPTVSKNDSDTPASAEPSRTNTGLSDSGSYPPSSSSTDGRPPGPSPAHRESKVRESSSKKKRKQANQVRSQQPLWAAIASTKVTFVKEMEQRDAAADAAEAAAMDTKLDVNLNTNATTDRMWIREVRDTEIFFSVCLSAQAALEGRSQTEEAVSVGAGIDKSKPFYIRVNEADWSTTRITDLASSDDGSGKTGGHFDGEIFGLAPLRNYHCELVGIATGQVICSASLITQPPPSAEQAASVPAPPQHQALRPSSPITTLKQSISSAESKLLETRNRSKRNKKDQKATHSDIKKDINKLRSNVENSGGLDEKQRQRRLQIGQHVHQAEEATATLQTEIEALGEIPEDEAADADAKRRVWQSAKDARSAANKDFDGAKTETDREIANLQSELNAALQKRERVSARHLQRSKDHDKLVSDQQAQASAKQQHDLQRFEEMQARMRTDQSYKSQIGACEAEAQSLSEKAYRAWQDTSHLQGLVASSHMHFSSPPTPEGILPGTNGSLTPQGQSNGFPSYPHPFSSPFNPQPLPRGRSSSMLSSYSGFTDNDDMFEARFQPAAHVNAGAAVEDETERNASIGTETEGSGSAESNSPRAGAKPFVPTKMSPIGPPKGKHKVSPLGAPLASPVGTSR